MRLLATSCGLLCIPLFLFQVYLIQSAVLELKTQTEQYYTVITENCASHFEDQLSIFREIALSASVDRKLQEIVSPTVSPYRYVEAVEILDGFCANLPIIDTLGIYYRNTGDYVTNNFRYNVVDYCMKVTNDDTALSAEMMEYLNADYSERYNFFSLGNSANCIFVSLPLRLKSITDYDALLVFEISIESLMRYFLFSTAHELLLTIRDENGLSCLNNFKRYYSIFIVSSATECGLAIIDLNGRPLFISEHFSTGLINSDEIASYISSDAKSFNLGDDSGYTIYKCITPNFIYLFSIKKLEMIENISIFYNSMNRSLLVCLFCIIVLILVTAYINYMPLNNLRKRLYQEIPNNSRIENVKEIDIIENAFDSMKKHISEQEFMLIEYVLNDMLYGRNMNNEVICKFASSSHSMLSKFLNCKNYCVVTVGIPQPNKELLTNIEKLMWKQSGIILYVTSQPGHKHSIFLCGCSSLCRIDAIEKQIISIIKEITQNECTAHAGKIVDSIYDIHESYISSRYNLAEECETSQASLKLSLPRDKCLRFFQFINEGNAEGALLALETLHDYILENEHIKRYLCCELTIEFIRCLNKTITPLSNDNIDLLMSLGNTESLFKLLHEFTRRACMEIADADKNMQLMLQNEIVKYVDQTYTNPGISLQNVADHFGISIYVLSRMFKEYTGVGFREYITQKRLELSCEILLKTNAKIAAISQDCGFESSTYFASLFKSKYGKTPSEYRALKSNS